MKTMGERTGGNRLVWGVATAAPLVYLAGMIGRYHFDAPFWDQWEMVPILEKAYDGALTLGDFWRPQNEHRVFFPKLLMFGMARLTRWHIPYEVAAGLILGVTLCAAYMYQVLSTARRTGREGRLWVLPVIALFGFSLSQWRNWMLGFHLTVFMTAACAAWSIVLLGLPEFRWRRFAGSAVLSIVATYSFGTGIATWLASGFLVLVMPAKTVRARTLRVAAWCVIGGLALLLFFQDYDNGGGKALSVVFQRPFACVQYVLAHLGAPGAAYSDVLASAFGAIAVAASASLTVALIRRRGFSFAAVAPYLAMELLAVSVAFLTALSRLDEGPRQALSSRYITWSTFFWIALVCKLYWYIETAPERGESRPSTSQRSALIAKTGVALIVLLGLINAAWGSYCADERHDAFLIGRRALLSGQNEQDLRWVHPRPDEIKGWVAFLRGQRLTVFKQGETERRSR